MDAHPVHGYLSCEDVQYGYRRAREALDRIVKRSCNHCSAWETACSGIGLTYESRQHEDPYDKALAHLDAWDAWFLEIVDRFIEQGRERHEARALARQLDAAITALRTYAPGVENKNQANQDASAAQKAFREQSKDWPK